jgi:signal transduction histidine kinase
VDNAVRHNAAGGWIQVATGMRGGQAYLTVTNGGPVIGEDATPLLFEPFRRLCVPAGSVPRTGLGLSIVRSVATAHQGTVMAGSRPAGGLDMSVLLPGLPAGVPSRSVEAATAS